MPNFEVHLPSVSNSAPLTFQVAADNWMAALKTGLIKLGDQGARVNNVLVDIQDDDSIHVTEPGSGRVFRIRELSETEAASAAPKLTRGPVPVPSSRDAVPTLPLDVPAAVPPFRPAANAPLPTPARVTAPSAVRAVPPRPSASAKLDPSVRQATVSEVGSLGQGYGIGVGAGYASTPLDAGGSRSMGSLIPASGEAPGSELHRARAVTEVEQPTRPPGTAIGRRPAAPGAVMPIEDLLSEVFERVQAVQEISTEEKALYFLLDLALEKIPAEAGTVYRAHAETGDLTFRAVRGPTAEALLRQKPVLPAGSGLAGFCVVEGVSVAVSEVEKDPRFYSAISEKLGFQTRSLLCSPMMAAGRTFGCIQLLNKKQNPLFSEQELGLLAYLAHQAARYLEARS